MLTILFDKRRISQKGRPEIGKTSIRVTTFFFLLVSPVTDG